jgi:hypothetical protein
LFYFILERIERIVPESVEPSTQLSQTLGIDVIHATCSFGSVFHETRFLQGFKVLRYSRPAHRQTRRQFADRLRAPAKSLEHSSSRRIA